MRVISVGPTVEDVLANPASEEWKGEISHLPDLPRTSPISRASPAHLPTISPNLPQISPNLPRSPPNLADFSIELCGGTHVTTTADASAFVLVEESAVAKGIRRVTGLTAAAAAAARASGQRLETSLAEIASSEVSSTEEALEGKRASLARLRNEVDAAVTSAHLKSSLRSSIETADKSVQKQLKALLAAAVDAASAAALEQAKAAAAEGRRCAVLALDPFARLRSPSLAFARLLTPSLAFAQVRRAHARPRHGQGGGAARAEGRQAGQDRCARARA